MFDLTSQAFYTVGPPNAWTGCPSSRRRGVAVLHCFFKGSVCCLWGVLLLPLCVLIEGSGGGGRVLRVARSLLVGIERDTALAGVFEHGTSSPPSTTCPQQILVADCGLDHTPFCFICSSRSHCVRAPRYQLPGPTPPISLSRLLAFTCQTAVVVSCLKKGAVCRCVGFMLVFSCSDARVPAVRVGSLGRVRDGGAAARRLRAGMYVFRVIIAERCYPGRGVCN